MEGIVIDYNYLFRRFNLFAKFFARFDTSHTINIINFPLALIV